jgi:hypothetical protein
VTIRKGLPAKLALTDADDTRYLFSGLVVCNADGSPRGGVLSPVGVNIVTSSATMNVSVARFQGAAVRDGGVVLLANDGAANVLLDAAPGANARIDVIYAKQNDASGTVTVPDANNTALLTFVKGTAGAVPVKPTLPVGALELATVLIPSGATATNSAGVVITQTAAFTAGAGAKVAFRTKTALDLWTTAAARQSAVVLADGVRYEFTGSTWELSDRGIFASARGKATSTAIAGAGGSAPVYWGGYEPVTFPAGRFTQPPIVVASPGFASGSVLIGVAVSSVTTTGFEYRLLRVGASPSSGSEVYWVAEQTTSAASAG